MHDFVEDETFNFVGVHGSVTEDEMYVPLIVIKT